MVMAGPRREGRSEIGHTRRSDSAGRCMRSAPQDGTGAFQRLVAGAKSHGNAPAEARGKASLQSMLAQDGIACMLQGV